MGHIKLWENMLDCPKVDQISDKNFRIWVKLLIISLRDGGPQGEFPSLRILKFRMRATSQRILTAIEQMHECGLIDKCESNPIGGMPWQIHDWSDWQTPKDPTSAARQARWREKQALRNASHNGIDNGVTNAVTEPLRNASHNALKRSVEGKKERRKENVRTSKRDSDPPRAHARSGKKLDPSPPLRQPPSASTLDVQALIEAKRAKSKPPDSSGHEV